MVLLSQEVHVNNNIGRMITTIRAARRMSQSELSKVTGVDIRYICEFETGRRRLTDYHLDKIQAGLGLDFDEVLPVFLEFSKAIGAQ